MTSWSLYALAGTACFGVGMYGLFARGDVLRRVLGASVVGTGVFLVLVAVARRDPDRPPDPVLHALVLTGIVVSVSATGLALALARRVAEGKRR